ncbi:hypothetical protein AGDE_15854 [Angomonas deanei]|uniref:Uncharacterized protein n=1 Tax=Angomonas deanei TaxID=59799 RepID=A0A7G2CBB8_9TRYP|nr:hypothetical protein AGDE_15854 [Angomonas deanei]CAD2216217.1 hypothetical protein, conserved [Angomonas deanei]|eukprot:EPY18263.1 hypothetical protein AGDE_15854 [Angomonas deanei]
MNVETIPPRKGSTVEAREAIVPNLDISATQLNSTSVGDSPKNKPTPSKGKEQHTSLPTSATESKRQSTAGEEIGLANIYRNPSSKNLSRHQSRAMLIAPSHVSEKADVNVFDDPFGERAAAAAAQPAAGREGSLRTKLLTEVQLQRIKQEQNERGLRIHEEATDLLEGYSEKRKVFQRAKELTKVMKGRADDVAEMEERNQLLRGAGGADHLVEELQAKTVGAKDAHSPSNREDYGVTDGFNVQAGEEENDTLGLESLEKVGKIQKLRSYQKSLTELDDAEEEEKRKRKRAGASQSNSNNASFYRRKNELSVQSSQVSAEELRKKFNALFGKNEERGNLPPEPPTTFTSAALGTTLEYLYRSISTIEEATNIICVTATFKSKDESATIAAPLRGLNENVAYAKACYEVLLSHLRHFESGQRALLDSGSSEVTALREQFLQKKETLTADQQKEKSLLEVRNGLKTKLLHLNKRCALWEQIFLSPGTENHLRLSYLQSRESNVSVRNMDSNRESIKPAKLINVFSLENNENSLSAYPFNEPHMEQSNGAIELPVDAMTSDAGSPSSIGNSTRAPHSTRAPKRSVTSATFSPGVVSTKKKTNYDNVSYLEQYLRS